ncbi:MAG: hypothetical protein OEV28_11055 [Nitrospirota bacterium]|nr:hypothetical protein [Nitrospirota bacterium]
MDILINDVLPTQSVTNTNRPLETEVAVMNKALDLQKAEGQAMLDLLAKVTQKGQTIDIKI